MAMHDTPAPVAAAGSEAGEGLFSWFRELSQKERRTFWACFGGWALDAMDVQLYSFVIPTVIGLWGLTKGQAGLIFTATLLSSSVGGWIVGMLADRIGRVRVLQLTILWFSVCTFLAGLTNSFEQLLAVRTLQGIGFGGEWAAGAVLIGEMIRDKHRGKGGGTVHSGWAVGWGAAALLYTVYFSALPEHIAWRVLFVTGLLPALFVLYLRRYVEEPAVFVAARERNASRGRTSGLAIFSPALLRTTLLAALLAVGAQGGYYAVMTWLPTYLKTERGLSVLNTGGYLSVIIVAAFLGYVVSAYLADIIGRRRNFFLFSITSVGVVLVYMLVPISDGMMLVLGFPLGFFASGIYSGIVAFFNELFPTSVRGSGIGFCFNFGRAIGAAFPTLVGVLSASVPLGQAVGIFTVGAYALIVIAALLLPETNGSALTDEVPEAA
jgi:MFS family permease